jgi:hypothetical protein
LLFSMTLAVMPPAIVFAHESVGCAFMLPIRG